MPRAYSEDEKSAIRSKLIAVGKKQINALGIRRVTVDDLTREAGISKGGFYGFFPSREDFILTVFESWEDIYRAKLLSSIQESTLPIRRRWEGFFLDMINLLEKEPGLAQFRSTDLDFLMTRLPPERLAAHQTRDRAVIQDAIRSWLDRGYISVAAAEALPGLIAAIFAIAIHRKDLPDIEFTPALQFIAAALAAQMPGEAT